MTTRTISEDYILNYEEHVASFLFHEIVLASDYAKRAWEVALKLLFETMLCIWEVDVRCIEIFSSIKHQHAQFAGVDCQSNSKLLEYSFQLHSV